MKSESEMLRERARKLALPLSEEADPSSLYEVLEFTLGQEPYCLETQFMAEIHPVTTITRLPGTPEFIVGLMAIRGRVVCVLDLKRWLGLPAQGLGDQPKVILLKDQTTEFGVSADSVGGIVRLVRDHLLPLPPGLSNLKALAKGITKEHGVLLDAKALLNDPSINVYQGDF